MYEQQTTFSTVGELFLKQSNFSEIENSLLLVGLEPTIFCLHTVYSDLIFQLVIWYTEPGVICI